MIRFFSVWGMITLVAALSGCGRVSKPVQPDNSFYPHTYYVTMPVENSTYKQNELNKSDNSSNKKGEYNEKNK